MSQAVMPLAAASFVLLFSVAGAFGGTTPRTHRSIDAAMDQLTATRRFTEVAISPDAKRAAWVEDLQNVTKQIAPVSAIYVLDLNAPNATPRRITGQSGIAPRYEHDLAWSPDGRRLAFLSDRRKPGQAQLYVADVATGATTRLTDLKGALAMPRWSPDGKVVAVLFTASAAGPIGPLAPRAVETGVIEEHVDEQRLMAVDPDSKRSRFVSPADLYVYEYDWSPDGKTIAAIGAHGSGDANWWTAELYRIATGSGETRLILKPSMQIARPRWSPDGRQIAFIGGLMSDAIPPAGDIFVVAVSGGAPRNLTPGMKASAGWLSWLSSPERILFASYFDGGNGIATVDAASGRITNLWSGGESITASDLAFTWSPSLSLTRDGQAVALIRQSFGQPPEVWAGAIGDWKQITHANPNQHRQWGDAQSIRWTSDGMTVQGWLLYPREFDRNRRYPMVVNVHGGPSFDQPAMWPTLVFDSPLFAAAGYFVLLPNPRGSYGQGESFTRANVKDFGQGDLRDILAGVDQVAKTLPVDRDRVGICGWSYGGYMTMMAVTQSDAFHAAVAGAGIANWQSYYGENGIDQWMIPFFGASVYDDPAVYARSSPMTFIKRAKTPTLVVVGERDEECPAPQSYEFWHALKTLGVETQLVVYPDEGHLFMQPDHLRDLAKRTIAWFDAHLKGSGK